MFYTSQLHQINNKIAKVLMLTQPDHIKMGMPSWIVKIKFEYFLFLQTRVYQCQSKDSKTNTFTFAFVF